jgi:crotonobetainyl-CoA:carnitine CoA-transferase CaiB-like acyl-CoA transferase
VLAKNSAARVAHAAEILRSSLTFSGTPVTEYRAPPRPGENTWEILSAIGYDEAKLETLRKQGVI